jgi:hypothetical protein
MGRTVVVPEANLERTDAGLVPAGQGWFVLNAREARWFRRSARDSLPLTGADEFEAESYFPISACRFRSLPLASRTRCTTG